MGKIRLDLDALSVESFNTAHDSGGQNGTVFGHRPPWSEASYCPCETVEVECGTAATDCGTCAATACGTCATDCGTCATACGNCDTSFVTCDPYCCRTVSCA